LIEIYRKCSLDYIKVDIVNERNHKILLVLIGADGQMFAYVWWLELP
jgi:hypothetical protein